MVNLLTATEAPILWTATRAGALLHSGIIGPGTAVASAELIGDTDENALLDALITAEVDVPTLPDGALEAGEIYDYAGTLVMVRQSHTRLDSHPAPTDVSMLALFLVHQPESDGVLWVAGEQVYVGTRRLHEDVLYECIQAHVTQAGWEPGTIGGASLWVVADVGEEPEAWVQPTGAHDAYSLGDRVTHNGQVWESLVNGNVWEPGTPGTWVVV